MQSAQAGGKFRMIGGQIVDRFGKVQTRLYLERLVHPFYLPGGGVDKYGKVDMVSSMTFTMSCGILSFCFCKGVPEARKSE